GRGYLGDPRRAPALRALEGDGVGRLRPRRALGRGARYGRTRRPLAGAARPDPSRGLRTGLRSRARLVRAVVRVARARREPAAHPARRLPPGERSAGARDDRGDRARAALGRARAALPDARGGGRRAAAGRRRLPAVLVLAL